MPMAVDTDALFKLQPCRLMAKVKDRVCGMDVPSTRANPPSPTRVIALSFLPRPGVYGKFERDPISTCRATMQRRKRPHRKRDVHLSPWTLKSFRKGRATCPICGSGARGPWIVSRTGPTIELIDFPAGLGQAPEAALPLLLATMRRCLVCRFPVA